MKTHASPNRLQYLDWMRGLGALIMLHGHVWDSFVRDDLRTKGPYIFSQFLGGMPPAIFLFLTGITLAFLMDSTERKGLGPRDRLTTAFKRSGYLFAVAFAFRLQMWVFGLPAPWQDLFRVDILNCMGLAIAVLSVMALFRTADRVRLCAALGLAIAFAAPLVSQIHWAAVPWMLRSYVAPDLRFFAFFPWAAYVAFGMSAGSAIRLIPQESIERAMQWATLGAIVTIAACEYCANLPFSIYTKSEYWLNSPAQILTKLGVILLMLSFSFVWTRYLAKDGWSWVRQLGTTSLLVYWVHIELVYGRGLFFLKNSLTEAETMVAAVLIIVLMLILSLIKTRWHQIRGTLADMGWSFGQKPDRVPGD
jgi:fucose 4-O-acetylase-like acetyltransferase